MSAEFFVCVVENGGYEFITLTHPKTGKEHLLLVPRATGAERFGKGFPLFELYPSLWRNFAELKPTEEAILAFASKYGALFPNANSKPKSPAMPVILDDGSPANGERFEMWEESIDEMKRLSGFWNLLCQNDTYELEKLLIAITPDQRRWIYAPSHRFVTKLRNRTLTKEEVEINFKLRGFTLPENFANPKLEDAARHVLMKSINEKLLVTPPEIRWETPKWNEPDTTRRHLGMRLFPKSLIDALWLQFAQAVTRRNKFVQCEWCKKWIVLEGKNSQKKHYCPKPRGCRQAAYRARLLAKPKKITPP
jgi:hypothetical protein